jgi:hypothetical protein
LDVLAVSQDILDILEPYGNVGEVMLDCLVNEESVANKLSELAGDPLGEIQSALDVIMMANLDELVKEVQPIDESEEEIDVIEDVVEEVATELEEPAIVEEIAEEEVVEELVASTDVLVEDDDEVLLDAFGEPIIEHVPAVVEPEPEPLIDDETEDVVPELPKKSTDIDDDDDDDDPFGRERSPKGKTKRRTERQKRRQLVLDEDSGELIAKRRRKSSRGTWDEETWEDYDY